MKKYFSIITALCYLFLLCSCGSRNDTGTPPGDDSISIAELVGSTEEVSYESLINEEMFKECYESYLDDNNPLQLKDGPFTEAVVAKPFKSVIVDDNDVLAPLNIWMYPVINNGIYIGFINCDIRYLNHNNTPSFFGGEMFAPKINEALKKGKIALFTTINGTYGMFDDNTTIMLDTNVEYTGKITFDKINQAYNLITSESVNEIIKTQQ
ncbi:hypothetical protein [Ruminococcus sp.]|uniref:hypothetical protein n=1 Tax=Ruminococcus sp. TaxID=41978 RepID=UPI002600F1CC|nr:hypothetical protein [Ruminococcus sp.]